MCEGNRAGYSIVINPSLTGPSWVSVNNNSGTEYDITASAFTGGFSIFRGFLPNTNDGTTIDINSLFTELGRKLRVNAFATDQDILLISGINEAAGGTTDMRCSVSWEEIR